MLKASEHLLRPAGRQFRRPRAPATLAGRVVAPDMAESAATLEAIRAAGGEGSPCPPTLPRRRRASPRKPLPRSVGSTASSNNAALYGAFKGGRFDTIPEADWDAAMLHETTSKSRDRTRARACARPRPGSIRFNAVAPSAMGTEGTREFFAEKLESALETRRSPGPYSQAT